MTIRFKWLVLSSGKLTWIEKKNVFNELILNLRFMQIEGKVSSCFPFFQTSIFISFALSANLNTKKSFQST